MCTQKVFNGKIDYISIFFGNNQALPGIVVVATIGPVVDVVAVVVLVDVVVVGVVVVGVVVVGVVVVGAGVTPFPLTNILLSYVSISRAINAKLPVK